MMIPVLTIADRRERRNPRHPEVGRARAPDLYNVRSKIRTKDCNGDRRRNNKPKGGRVKIFNDTGYIKAVKVPTILWAE